MSKVGILMGSKSDFDVVKPAVNVLKKFGVETKYDSEENKFIIEPSNYVAKDYIVEGDFSSASYPIAATTILSGLAFSYAFAIE